MKKNTLESTDTYEKELSESLEADEWIPVEDKSDYIAEAQEYAQATMRKDRRMNIRMSERDMRNLKIVALQDGIPYQTLVSMILHKYLNSRLEKDKKS